MPKSINPQTHPLGPKVSEHLNTTPARRPRSGTNLLEQQAGALPAKHFPHKEQTMTTTIAQRFADRQAEYREYVEALSLGERIDLEAAEQCCSVLGQPFAGLAAEADRVASLRERRGELERRADPERIAKVRRELAEAQAEIDAANEALKKPTARLAKAQERYAAIHPTLNEIARDVEQAKRDLDALARQ